MRNETSNWVGRLLCGAVFSIAAVHCGGATEKTGGTSSGGSSSSTNQPDAGTDLGACSSSDTCPSGSSCYFKVGSCAAAGRCIENPQGGGSTECAIEAFCGCDGSTVTTGCGGFPAGYASGPTLGSESCDVPTPPDPFDGGQGDDGGQGGDDEADGGQGGDDEADAGLGSDGGVEAGIVVGPCDSSGGCSPGAVCSYPIGSCSAVGQCITIGSGPQCGAVEALCGCDGPQSYTGCGFATGYASAPATGSCGTALPVPDAGH